MVARILFVRWGILYGASAVSHVDAIIGALVAIGVAVIAWGLAGAKGKSAAASNTDAGARWMNWVPGVTTLAGAATLVVSLVNLLQPLEPPGLAMRACPGARDNSVPYAGITSATEGVNSRQGPARSYLANGRFPAGCSVGFAAYCLGDPIIDQGGVTTDETWVTSRWLLVAKQPGGWRSTAARILSGENPGPQFVSNAFVTPETPYDQLPIGTPRQCPGTFPYPGKTRLQPFNASAGTFTAAANHAINMGFAIWIPPRQGFVDGGAYLQLVTPVSAPALTSADNPGASPDGTKTVEWDYKNMLPTQARHAAGDSAFQPGHVVIMAIPCLADNIPAKTSTAAIAGYDVPETGVPAMNTNIPSGLEKNRLARAACEVST